MINALKYMAIATSFGLGIRRATSLLREKFSKTQRYASMSRDIEIIRGALNRMNFGMLSTSQHILVAILVSRGRTKAAMVVHICSLGYLDLTSKQISDLTSTYEKTYRNTINTGRAYQYKDMQLQFRTLIVRNALGGACSPHVEQDLGICKLDITNTQCWEDIKRLQRELLYAHSRWKSIHRDCDVSALRIIR